MKEEEFWSDGNEGQRGLKILLEEFHRQVEGATPEKFIHGLFTTAVGEYSELLKTTNIVTIVRHAMATTDEINKRTGRSEGLASRLEEKQREFNRARNTERTVKIDDE